MNVVRWVFRDMRTNQTYTVELNPNEANSFRYAKQITFGASRYRQAGFQHARQPVDWTFSGVVRTQSHHDALVDWHDRPGKVRVTDHLGRTFEVMIRSLEMTDRRPTATNEWRMQYTFNTLLLRRIA